jgi:hypothetical protein
MLKALASKNRPVAIIQIISFTNIVVILTTFHRFLYLGSCAEELLLIFNDNYRQKRQSTNSQH